MNKFMSGSRRIKIRRGQVLTPLLLLILVLPSLIAFAAPIKEDPISEFTELLQNTQSLVDDTIDEEEIIQQAETLLRSQFTENHGQVGNEEILFYGSIPGGMIGFGVSEILIWLDNTTECIILSFVNANEISPRQESLSSHKSNYFLGDRGSFTDVSSSEIVFYEGLWDGIDLQYRATPQGAKYEFIVQPGINPNKVKIRYEQFDSLEIIDNSLVIQKQGKIFRDANLLVYQEGVPIDASLMKLDSDVIIFDIPNYDPSLSLTIDPLIYSTYLGGSGNEIFGLVALDSSGNMYVSGQTSSSNFPIVGTTVSSFNFAGICFVSKLNASGNEMIYSTFIGGTNGPDYPVALVVDASGNVSITGSTESSDFPTVNAYDTTSEAIAGGYVDTFVCKLNSTGDGFIYSTFVGGSEESLVKDMDIDSFGNAYVVGYTQCSDFPLVNAVDAVTDNDEGFLFKLNQTGNGLIYSTYLGGTSSDEAMGVAVDQSGNAYVTGWTDAIDFVTVNAYQDTSDGSTEIFLLKVNSTGTGLNYSTYFGATDWDIGYSVDVDSEGNAYVAGVTDGPDFPVLNAYDSTFNGVDDVVVLKMNATGNGLMYSTFIGGGDSDISPKILVDDEGNTHIVCLSYSSNFPMWSFYDNQLDGFSDFAVFKLNSTGNGLLWSTFIGGSNNEGNPEVLGIDVDASGYTYVAGATTSSDFPMVNAYNSTFGGDSDCIVFKLADNPDYDNDGLGTYYETLYGTDEFDPDSDDDNLIDGNEVFLYGTDPTDGHSPGWNDTLATSSYIGGSSSDYGYAIAVDSEGNIYLCGITQSANFPKVNPIDSSLDGGNDCFILKINASDNTLIYSTFIGGSSSADHMYSIAVDNLGNVYATGYTGSTDFPTPVGYDTSYNGGYDVFVLKLNPAGNGIVYSTFVSGTGQEGMMDIAIDSAGCAYVAGQTTGDFPMVNAFDDTYDGSTDVFVFKLNATGTGLDFSTYLGSTGNDYGYSIAVDTYGNSYVTGTTSSSGYPTVNAYDSSFNGNTDIFVTKLNSTGNGIIFSTFIGSSNYESARSIALDSENNIFVGGYAQGSGFPTVSAYDDSYNGGTTDIVVLKLNYTGNELVYSTYIGGSEYEHGQEIVVDNEGCVFITGGTGSVDFPTMNPYDDTHNGNRDVYVLQLNSTGNGLNFSTFIGGNAYDEADNMAIGPNGICYLVGRTSSPDFPTVNPYDSTLSGTTDVFFLGIADSLDIDEDGLSFREEMALGTDPYSNDSDQDQVPDGWEVQYGFDPLVNDSANDPDLDTLSNLGEFLYSCNPLNNDSDSDFINDWDEIFTYGTDPNSQDSDLDSLNDWDEINIHGTDPLNLDSDFDQMPDAWEISNGLDPMFDDAYDDLDLDLLLNLFEWGNGTLANNNDTDFDQMPDGWEVNNALNATFNDALDDLDLDTLSNLGEYQNGTLPWNPDCDSDTLSDGSEVLIHHTDPLSEHSDSDIMPDGWEVLHGLDPLSDDSLGDPDTDLLLNEDEYAWGTDPWNPDSDSDSYTDGYEVHTLGSDPMNPLSPNYEKQPEFSTYIGGSSADVFYDAIIDSNGNIYLTGYVGSTNFPVVGAYDSTHNGGWDTVVVKLNSTGNGMIFSTYIGGSGTDRGLEFYIASDFSVWLSGGTTSSNFPTVNAYDSTFNGGWDGFIIHLSNDGSSLLYSTYMGGSGDDSMEYITFDDDGYFYCSGYSVSSNFPTASGYDTTFNGNRDGVAFKMQPDMQSLVYSTFVGGTGDDYVYGSRLCTNGDFIISGRTTSTNFPTVNPYDSTHNGDYDIFVTRLNADGNALVYSTYIGGGGEEYFGKFDIDDDENLFMGGSTASANFPVLNAYDSTHNGGWDAYALKLAANGSSIFFSTFIGGSSDETVYGVELDHWNNIHLSGVTTSIDLPIVNAFQNESQGGDDTFVFKVNSTGNGLLYSTYLGGSGNDGQRGMAIDGFGRVYIVGWTESADHPTFNAYDDTLSGVSDGFVTCFPPLDDSDLDGLPDEIEIAIGSNRFSNDSDSDLMPDAWEYFNSLNVTGDDAAGDEDSDGLLNLDEFLYLTDPQNNDTDSDFLLDGLEIHTYGSNPKNNDTDSDNALDGIEVLTYGTSPTNPDSDSDLIPDGWEIDMGLDPLTDDAGEDPDTDDLTNLEEYQYGTDPFNPDTDSDGATDGEEVKILGSDPLDPTSNGVTHELEFSSFIGGNNQDISMKFVIDENDNIYMCGYTYSFDFPTLNAYDSTHNTDTDCFIFKFDPTGQILLYSTFVGGYYYDYAWDMVVDSSGNAFVAGYTRSSDFPLVNPLDSVMGGDRDSFVFKLSPEGNQLLFSTFYGGSGYDAAHAIEIDDVGNVYVAGYTGSSDFATVNAYDPTYNGDYDTILYKLNPSLTQVLYATYWGGSSDDACEEITVSPDGSVTVIGRTYSSNFPIANAYDSTHNGNYDAYVTSFNAAHTTLLFSSYFGGSANDFSMSGTVDSEGNIYVIGQVSSSDFPTLNALDSTYNGGSDMSLWKLNATGGLQFSTFIGGDSDDYANRIELDSFGNIYIVGSSYSNNFPPVRAYDDTKSGSSDAVLIKLTPSADEIRFSTFIGGSLGEDIAGVGITSGGQLIFGGYTYSSDFPMVNSWDNTSAGSRDVFIAKLPNLDDADGDGLGDDLEVLIGTSMFNNDTDSDLMPDGWEYIYGLNPLVDDSSGDLDSDLLLNLQELGIGTFPNNNDTDLDYMLDGWEYYNSLNPLIDDASEDMDSDDLTNLQEHNLGSNPANSDTDSDLMPDFWEYTYGLNLLVDDSAGDFDSDGLLNIEEYHNGCNPASGDSDSDELGDLEEIETYGTDPLVSDTDRDLLDDGYEILTVGTDPLTVDSDNDTLSDGFEVLQYGTNPTLYDTDLDLMSDGEEYLAGTNPLVADANDDEDGDGLSNIEEWDAGTDIFDADSDNDGTSDYDEIMSGSDPLRYDIAFPMNDFLIIAALIIVSVIPGLVVVLSNERMYRKTRRVQSGGTESNSDSEKEV